MCLKIADRTRLFSLLQSFGWTPHEGTIWARGDSYFLREYGLADIRQIETAALCGLWDLSELERPFSRWFPACLANKDDERAAYNEIATLVFCLDQIWEDATRNIRQATEDYEGWLRTECILNTMVEDELLVKHARMTEDVFSFLIATYYRWAQRWPDLCPDLADAPQVNCVGDLHVENFGTWQGMERQRVWGVYDFDEAYPLPYTNDLVRLATSAKIAIMTGRLSIEEDDAFSAILRGYSQSLDEGGRSFVLAQCDEPLRRTLEPHVDPDFFWEKLDELPTVSDAPPELALRLIEASMPEPGIEYRLARRLTCSARLGHLKYTVLARWKDRPFAMDAVELSVPVSHWARPNLKRERGFSCLYHDILSTAVRVWDPWLHLNSQWHRPQWLMRRIAPDSCRMDLKDLSKDRNERILLEAMGRETANIHLGTKSILAAVKEDLGRRDRQWVSNAATVMASAVVQDWQEWRQQEQNSLR